MPAPQHRQLFYMCPPGLLGLLLQRNLERPRTGVRRAAQAVAAYPLPPYATTPLPTAAPAPAKRATGSEQQSYKVLHPISPPTPDSRRYHPLLHRHV